jgi:hypothetical protein
MCPGNDENAGHHEVLDSTENESQLRQALVDGGDRVLFHRVPDPKFLTGAVDRLRARLTADEPGGLGQQVGFLKSSFLSRGSVNNSSHPSIRQSVSSCRPDFAVGTKMRACWSADRPHCSSIALSSYLA